MSILSIETINLLQDKDKEKLSYFVELLFQKKEYKKLEKEIALRKDEVKNKETISHDELWKSLDV